ncbi:hypothetical protein [Natrinema soli]|uniref:Uncharacterized protein n=1 Tax=Natrinema soli TaxID=1930624 RepID=A0ABD5SZ51_9EURY|nr:hypothetical protein [Natrinema soli]
MELPCFEARLNADEAIDRTDRLTPTSFLVSTLRSLLGRSDDADPDVTVLYYPDYLAYTTVTLRRVGRSDKDDKFIAAVDAATGRVGEVDVTLPDIETREVPDERVVPIEYDEDDAEREWDEWLFSYVDRTYRPVKRPETSLDRLELVYTPYYVVDYGPDSDEDRYAVSALTKQVELLEDIPPLADEYAAPASHA